MSHAFAPVFKQSLSDDLAREIKGLIDSGAYGIGDRLPTIAEMARRFGVGPPTIREALKRLETVGAVTVRHGSGVYVAETHNTLFLSNPVHASAPSKKTLLDLIEARVPIEVQSVALAAEHATAEHAARMEALLAKAEANHDDDAVLSATNMAFHREIAAASGNAVVHQLLDVLASLFRDEQRAILNIYGSRRKDHAEHRGILDALVRRDREGAVRQMRAHLDGVRVALLRWDPDAAPLHPLPLERRLPVRPLAPDAP